MSDKNKQTFEHSFARLEKILEELNSGKTDLQDALKLYEEASGLMKFCENTLVDAEKKISMLIKTKDGSIELNQEGQPQHKELPPL